MKRKINLIILTVLMLSLLMVLFTFAASAQETEEITVEYSWYNGTIWETAKPNADGSYTLRDTKKSGNATITLADGTVVDREFYGWFDCEGNIYKPGETVNFTKSTVLYEAYGVTVDNAADLEATIGNCYVKLAADITMTKSFGREWTTDIINLNGHTLTVTTNSTAMFIKRGSFIIHGGGKFVHAPVTIGTHADERAIHFQGHGYGDDSHPQHFWIGKGVEFTTPYNALYEDSRGRDFMPRIVIAGTVNAKNLVRYNCTLVESTCYITEDAVLNLTNNLFEFKNTTGTSKYMTVTLDGTINVGNGNGTIFTEFALEKIDFVINGGKFCINTNDAANIGYYLSDSLMLKETTENDLTWYEIVPSDCVHNWIKSEVDSINPTVSSFGKDVFNCDLCGREKTVVTVYDPSNTEVKITVLDENNEPKEVTVKVGDVLDIITTGVGENTSYTFVGVKGNDMYPQESIIAVEIPVGVSIISASNANATLETINIASGANVTIVSLAGLTGIKSINVDAANVTVNSIGSNKTLEGFYSRVAGATVVFNNACFDGKSNLKYLVMSNGSTYKFSDNCFRKTGIEEVIFPDEVNVEFVGNAAFYEAAVKYVYFGKSITKIYNKPFDCANNLETVVIMAATNITDYCFCVANANNSKSVVKIYCHSEKISFTGNTFINRNSQGIEFYTIDPSITSVSGCKYVVYNGIPHAYTEGVIKEPTCIETGLAGSTTDCVCGINEITSYTVYTKDGSEERTTAQRELPLSEVHVLGTTLADINYKEGIIALGTKEYFCALCTVATVEEAEPTADAIITCYGYSACTYGNLGIVQSYGINHVAYNEYKAVNPSFAIGAVVMANYSNEEAQPLTVENGGVKEINEKVVLVKFNLSANDYFEIKVTGFNDTQKDVNIVFCAYAFDGENVAYIENGNSAQGAVGRTYNSIFAEN
ncbi:MAG: leucine-rich repeat protein [Clostridia bacterium]|nr:leucine-rich repeat protein [Clostridia bacterium]